MMKRRTITINLFWLLSLLSFTWVGCTDELTNQGGTMLEEKVWATLHFRSAPHAEVTTRSTLNDLAENKVENFFLFVFNSTGKKVYGKWYDYTMQKSSATEVTNASEDCWSVANTANVAQDGLTDGQIKLRTNAGTGYKIYAIANINADMIYISSDLLNSQISTEEQLLNLTTKLNQEIVSRNGYFPMVARATDVNITSSAVTIGNPTDGKLHFTRIDAKIRITFKQGNTPDERGQVIKSFNPKQWRVVNVPKKTYVCSYEDRNISNPSGGDAGGETDADYFNTPFVNFETFPEAGTGEFSFYMMENRKAPKQAVTTYEQRSLQVKDAAGNNLNTASGKRQFAYANDYATYVEVTGEVEMDLVDDDAGQTLGGEVKYLIHLGDFKESNSNYNVKRNTYYHYTVTVNSVNNIRVEVETGTTENQPGAMGDVTIAKEEVALCDAHYVSKTITFHAKYVSDDLTWYVCTPFCDGQPLVDADGVDNPAGLDYKWVHFRLNKKDANGNYYSDQRRAYTTTLFETRTSWQDNPDGMAGYHNDGLMDIIQLVQYIKEQKRKYDLDPTTGHDFDNTGGTAGGPKISLTVFVDEYYYETNPITGKKSATLWKQFVNTHDRYMHILCDSNVSADGESRATGSVVTIQQRAIQSIFNTSLDYTDLTSAWGIEFTDEHPDVWTYNNEGTDTSRNSGNTDSYNGQLNSVMEWGLWDGTSVTEDHFKTGVSWSDYLNVEVNNDTPLLNDDKRYLRYSCMARNRDNNGNGLIDADEIRWYTAAVKQLVGMWIGADVLDHNSRLYHRTAEEQASTETAKWRQHVISSTQYDGNSNNPTVAWGEEGCSTGDLYGSTKYGELHKWSVRCVRNLGDDEHLTDFLKPTDDYMKVVNNADGGATITATHLNEAVLRYYTSRELDFDDELSEQNRLYKSFEVAATTKTGEAKDFFGLNDAVTASTSGNPYCPSGYRLPNQRELAVMIYYVPDLVKGGQRFSRTYFSKGNRGTQKDEKQGYSYEQNLFLTQTHVCTTPRCVRDVRQ